MAIPTAAEINNNLKTLIRRLLRCSCKSIAEDVAVAVHTRCSSELLPRRHSFSSYDHPLLTSEVDGRKCPPSSPIIPKDKKVTRRLHNNKGYSQNNKCLGFERMHDNGAFESDRERLPLAAVVKRSSTDPYSDFRASMVEMIVENHMFGAKDLENLLECFLSLNARHHHKVIVQVFADIWEALLL